MIIGLTGAPRTGKTEVCKEMVRNHAFRKISIGDEIKKVSHYASGSKFKELDKDLPRSEINGMTPRDLYIYIGQMDEKFGPDFWVRRMLRNQIPDSDPADSCYVIESVGKQAQWTAVLRYCMDNGVYCRLLNLERDGKLYTDNREPIGDRLHIEEIQNNGEGVHTMKKKIASVVEYYWDAGQVEGRNWSEDLRWIQNVESK